MSSSSTDTTCGGNNELRSVLHTNNRNEKKLLLRPKITFVSATGSIETPEETTQQLFQQDGYNSINFIPTTRSSFNEPKLIHPPRPIHNGDISKVHPNHITLSPMVELIGRTNTDPNHMITPNMTMKDRERRAALLADSPELPSKPPLESKRPKIFGGKYGLRGSSSRLDIHSNSYLPNTQNNITSSSTEADDDSSSAGFSTSRQSCRSSSSQSESTSSSCWCIKYSITCLNIFKKKNNKSMPQRSPNHPNDSCSFFRRSSVWKSLLLGQLLSLLLCTMSVLSEIITDTYSTKIPTGQSLLTYTLLFLVYFPLSCCHLNQSSQQQQVPASTSLSLALKNRGPRYLVFAVIDVEANYLLHKAFQYTTFTSIQLLDCFSIPMILVLSWTFLRCRYRLTHIGGMALGLMSVVVLVWVDIDDGKGGVSSGGNKRMVGDILTLGSALLFGVAHVGLQHSVYFYNSYEFLGCIGLFGTIITIIQMLILERSELTNGVRWESWEIGILLAAFTAAQVAYYSCLPFMLKFSTAAELHLSHLSTDFYSILAGSFFFKTQFKQSHLVSAFLVITGLIVFNLHEVPHSPNHTNRSSFHRQQHYRKSEEAESEISLKCDKETVNLSNGLFANRRASTSLLPSSTEVRLTSNKLPNGYSPSRRSVQSYRAPSQCSFKDHIDNCMESTLLHFPSKQMITSNGNIRVSTE